MRDFFISFTKADAKMAEWVAWTLEANRYSVIFQSWDFSPGGNFILGMHQATVECARTIAVLSADYLASVYTQPEWAAALKADANGVSRKLIPVRVAPCEPPGLLAAINYIDLVGLDRTVARKRLLDGVKEGHRPKPASEPPFPGRPVSRTSGEEGDVAARLNDLLTTTRRTFEAQIRLRDRLRDSIVARLGKGDSSTFEELFTINFHQLTSWERNLHSTIRGYTKTILRDHNQQIATILEEHSSLSNELESYDELRHHLRMWLARYDATFEQDPSLCLLYVGPIENAAFPAHVDDEVAAYLARLRRAAARKSGREAPAVAIAKSGAVRKSTSRSAVTKSTKHSKRAPTKARTRRSAARPKRKG